MTRMHSSVSCLLFFSCASAHSQIADPGIGTYVFEDDDVQGLEMLQIKGHKEPKKCPMPDMENYQAIGKGCFEGETPNGEDHLCLGRDHIYQYLEEAWKACGHTSGCGAVMQTPNGQFQLRRASDPDLKDDSSRLYMYDCNADEQESKVEKKDAQIQDEDAELEKKVKLQALQALSDQKQTMESFAASFETVSKSTRGPYFSHNGHHSVDLWTGKGNNQMWTFVHQGNDVYTIEATSQTTRGPYLSHARGSFVDLWIEVGDNQKWKVEEQGNGEFYISPYTHPEKVYLTHDGNSQVSLSTSKGANSKWRFSGNGPILSQDGTTSLLIASLTKWECYQTATSTVGDLTSCIKYADSYIKAVGGSYLNAKFKDAKAQPGCCYGATSGKEAKFKWNTYPDADWGPSSDYPEAIKCMGISVTTTTSTTTRLPTLAKVACAGKVRQRWDGITCRGGECTKKPYLKNAVINSFKECEAFMTNEWVNYKGRLRMKIFEKNVSNLPPGCSWVNRLNIIWRPDKVYSWYWNVHPGPDFNYDKNETVRERCMPESDIERAKKIFMRKSFFNPLNIVGGKKKKKKSLTGAATLG